MKDRKKQRIIVIFSATLLIAVCVWRLLYLLRVEENEKIYEGLRHTYIEDYADSQVTDNTAEKNEADTGTKEGKRGIDFDALQKTNQDIYAWIIVENTQVDYPILQNKEDNYYLNHCINGSRGNPGCIYTNSCTAKDFSSWNTIIYGHNMKNGSMFGSLQNSDSFLTETEYINIITPVQNICYRTYAVIEFSDVYIPIEYDETSQTDRERFLKDVQEAALQHGHLREDMEVSIEDKLLTLSTCIKREDNKRLLVIGVQK